MKELERIERGRRKTGGGGEGRGASARELLMHSRGERRTGGMHVAAAPTDAESNKLFNELTFQW